MSTFNGIVSEFPEIRIDFFRRQPDQPPPLACFLSHVHSDHLAGLDTLRSPFVYCSAATREILLRLEKFTCRINYVRGIIEARQQTYRPLRKVLKALPLEAPTVIELSHGHNIQVTLFDANHCPGSTMFLIEGQGNAILYTGDIRAEPWFVNSLARNPSILEYTCGLKTLDKMYLDTSFLEDIPFQTKSEGIADLLAKVRRYPKDTIFHLQAWTFGYEDVWIALSKALSSRVHVDDYKLRIFSSLKSQPSDEPFAPQFHLAAGAAVLTGHMCGNAQQLGCLTSDTDVRIHSCEKSNMCSVAKSSSVVSIRPIVCRFPGGETMMEAGVGGGGTDFSREAELNCSSAEDIDTLLESLPTWGNIDDETKRDIMALVTSTSSDGRGLSLNISIEDFGEDLHVDAGPVIHSLVQKLRNKVDTRKMPIDEQPESLPRVILFPFARHSPYRELSHLVETFRPKDIWPCTVDKRWVEKGTTIESLFGKYCSRKIFQHDKQMALLIAQQQDAQSREATTPIPHSQLTDTWHTSIEVTPKVKRAKRDADIAESKSSHFSVQELCAQPTHPTPIPSPKKSTPSAAAYPALDSTELANHHSLPLQHQTEQNWPSSIPQKRPCQDPDSHEQCSQGEVADSQMTNMSSISGTSAEYSALRRDAYDTMLSNVNSDGPWRPISLLSADGHHYDAEIEL